jgi:hypothetical protein
MNHVGCVSRVAHSTSSGSRAKSRDAQSEAGLLERPISNSNPSMAMPSMMSRRSPGEGGHDGQPVLRSLGEKGLLAVGTVFLIVRVVIKGGINHPDQIIRGDEFRVSLLVVQPGHAPATGFFSNQFVDHLDPS